MLHKKTCLFHSFTLTLQTASLTILINTFNTMKRVITFSLLLITAVQLFARDSGQVAIILRHKGGAHSEYFNPADMPEAYYNTDTEEIIIVADGFSSYYDVDIVSQSTMQLVLYTTISGYGDSIDVSLLPDDDYKIVITSSYNNVYEGQFTNY